MVCMQLETNANLDIKLSSFKGNFDPPGLTLVPYMLFLQNLEAIALLEKKILGTNVILDHKLSAIGKCPL